MTIMPEARRSVKKGSPSITRKSSAKRRWGPPSCWPMATANSGWQRRWIRFCAGGWWRAGYYAPRWGINSPGHSLSVPARGPILRAFPPGRHRGPGVYPRPPQPGRGHRRGQRHPGRHRGGDALGGDCRRPVPVEPVKFLDQVSRIRRSFPVSIGKRLNMLGMKFLERHGSFDIIGCLWYKSQNVVRVAWGCLRQRGCESPRRGHDQTLC